MWFYIAAVAFTIALMAFYVKRQRSRTHPGKPGEDMEISSEIGVPASKQDLEKKAIRDRTSGVSRPAVPQIRFRRPRSRMEISDEILIHKHNQLPGQYNKDTFVLMPRDPNWVYAYWEITHERLQKARKRHLQEWGLSQPLIRLYDITQNRETPELIDVCINDFSNCWYIDVRRPKHRIVGEIGRLLSDKRFIPLARSNEIILPADSESDLICEEWAPIGYGYERFRDSTSSPWIWRR